MTGIERITIDPAICYGKPCTRGMRWPVEAVLDLLASGMSQQEILSDHTELEAKDFRAALIYARRLASGEALSKAA